MAIFVVLRHLVTILVTDFTSLDNLTNDLLILNSLLFIPLSGFDLMSLSQQRYLLITVNDNSFSQESSSVWVLTRVLGAAPKLQPANKEPWSNG